MQTLKAGDKAPDFTLLDANENSVTLSELLKKHRVLVYFYPKAMTPAVPSRLKTYGTIASSWKNLMLYLLALALMLLSV